MYPLANYESNHLIFKPKLNLVHDIRRKSYYFIVVQ